MKKLVIEVDSLEDTLFLLQTAQAAFIGDPSRGDTVRRLDSLITQIQKKIAYSRDGTDHRDPILLEIAEQLKKKAGHLSGGYPDEGMLAVAKTIEDVINNWV